jgi:hypothetical protein
MPESDEGKRARYCVTNRGNSTVSIYKAAHRSNQMTSRKILRRAFGEAVEGRWKLIYCSIACL